jgi:hypothetical protein
MFTEIQRELNAKESDYLSRQIEPGSLKTLRLSLRGRIGLAADAPSIFCGLRVLPITLQFLTQSPGCYAVCHLRRRMGSQNRDKSAGEVEIVIRLISAKNIATIYRVGLVGSDDECHRTIQPWIGKGCVVDTFACFVAAGTLGSQDFAIDRQSKIRDQLDVGPINTDVPVCRYLSVVFAHSDFVTKRHCADYNATPGSGKPSLTTILLPVVWLKIMYSPGEVVANR